ncbi:hypothetical protein NONI108955_25395 [Nocardia ninae]
MLWDDARSLHRLPTQLHQQPLVRIHGFGFAWADPEEGSVEAFDVWEEAALEACIGHAVDVPPVCRHIRDDISTVMQDLPELFGGVRAAREPACHGQHGNRLVVGRSGGGRDSFATLALEGIGQGPDRGVLEDQTRVQGATKLVGYHPDQLDELPRAESELNQRPISHDVLCRDATCFCDNSL